MLRELQVQTRRLLATYAEAGAGEQVVVFLHGNFGSWRWWELALQALPEGVRGLAVTMRGCHGTHGGKGPYAVDDLADDVEAFAEALGLTRFHLVGHSIGGAIALEYALRFPHRVTGLDLVAPAPGDSLESMTAQDTHTGWVLRQFDPQHPLDRAMLLSALKVGRDLGTNRPYLRQRLLAFMPAADTGRFDFEKLVRDASRMEPLAILGLYRGLASWDVRERCGALRVPTRVLAGKLDVLVPPESLEALAREIPGARYQLEADAGHCPMLEHPDRFARWLAEGLRRPPQASTSALTVPTHRRGPVEWLLTGPARGFWRPLVASLDVLLGGVLRRSGRPMLEAGPPPGPTAA